MFSRRLKRLTPYVPGEQPRDRSYIKLNTNENPYPPGPEVERVIARYNPETLRRYPDPTCTELRASAAAAYGVRPSQVFAGNGSDEVLSFAFFAGFDSAVAFADPSYSFYPVYCDFYGIEAKKVPLDDQLGIDIETLASTPDVDGMVIANPNSPTGSYLAPDRIETALNQYSPDRMVVVDEAYIAFGGESVVPLIDRFENLLVVHTFSKGASMAGLRLGLAFGSERIIDALFRAKDAFNSYPVHDLAQRIGAATLAEPSYYRAICDRIIATRARVFDSLTGSGWQVVPSRANFMFVKHPVLAGRQLYEALKERGILVRHFSTPELTDYLRITIGTDEEMDALLTALDAVTEGNTLSGVDAWPSSHPDR